MEDGARQTQSLLTPQCRKQANAMQRDRKYVRRRRAVAAWFKRQRQRERDRDRAKKAKFGGVGFRPADWRVVFVSWGRDGIGCETREL